MKKIFSLAALISSFLLITSCDNGRDYDEITDTEAVKIDSVKIVSNSMNVYEVQSIRTYSTFTSGCEGFYIYDYQKSGLERQVTAIGFKTNRTCSQSTNSQMSQFNFQPVEAGTYTFKFAQGNNNFITKTIVVQ